MTIKNLDTDRTYYFTNTDGFTTVWKMVNGELVGTLFDRDGGRYGQVTFPISK